MRALSFSLSAVALALLTTAPSPWDDPSREEPPSGAGEPVEQTSFLGPVALAEAWGLSGPDAAPDGASRWLDESTRWLDESTQQAGGIPREFYFSRVQYSSYRGGFRRGGSWRTDYPRADQIFLSFIDRLLPNLDAFEREFVVRLDDPELRRFPFLYALEVGRMGFSGPEVEGLREGIT